MNKTFKETQKFTQTWLKIVLIVLAIFPIYGIYRQIILEKPFGEHPMSDFGLILFTLFIFGIIALFIFMKLETEINQDGIKMKFIPFVHKKINWDEIKTAQVVDYGFVGWGIRIGTKYGIVYNTKGSKGLAIELKNGKKFLIGSQKNKEIQEIVNLYLQAEI